MTRRISITVQARAATRLLATLGFGALAGTSLGASPIPSGPDGYRAGIQPFFEANCVKCHGPEKSKGKLTLHNIDGDLAAGKELPRWEDILDVLSSGEMPPEDEDQPSDADRKAVIAWIDGGLRGQVEKGAEEAPVTTVRRLTNFEYQNTMRDLLGFELDLANNLPEDPKKPYHFNNTSEFMLLGPEQVDRYLENARRAMASAIVDPGKPEVHRKSWTFEPNKNTLGESQPDEIGVFGGNRRSVSNGVVLNDWPKTGEYRIRIKAAAILPPGFEEVPLRLVMGSTLRHDAGTGDYYPVGTVNLHNDVDHLREYEFRGRIENHPFQVGLVTDRGQQPPTMQIYPQNLFDNGELNDHRRSAFDSTWQLDVPRAVVRSIEFESPVTDVWPPEHHTRILFDSPLRTSNPKAYVRAVLEKFMSRAFRRPATAGELDRFASLHDLLAPEFETFEAAMRETLSMVLISPQFLYHNTSGDGVTPPQYELASKLSYFLWGSMLDWDLLWLADKGGLNDPKVLEKEVRRMLADERSKGFVRNFTNQWLSIEKMKAVKINQNLFPRFLYTVHVGERKGQEVLFRPTIRDYMQEETIGFVAELIKRNASVLNFVDSDFAWLNEPLAAHYGIAGVKGNGFRAVPIKPEQHLGGLMTQGAMLVGNATGSAPHPIYRAVWLREAILGDEVSPPPAEVPALSDSAGAAAETAVSIKDLLRLHRKQESCNDCHSRLDPWGIPFEQYNAVGRYQPFVPKDGTTVRGFSQGKDRGSADYEAYLKTVNTVEVDSKSRVPLGPEVNGVRELKDYLLRERKDDIARNLVRRLLAYAIGRDLTYRDRFAVEKLLKDSKANDYRITDMIVSICLSDIFKNSPQTTRP